MSAPFLDREKPNSLEIWIKFVCITRIIYHKQWISKENLEFLALYVYPEKLGKKTPNENHPVLKEISETSLTQRTHGY